MTRYLYGTVIALALMLIVTGVIGAQEREFTLQDEEKGDMVLGLTQWTVTMLGGNTLPDGVQITARFEEGRIGGSAACNSYFSSTEIDGSTISFGMIGMTMRACQEPLMQLDAAYMAALEQTASYQIADDQLALFDAYGAELVRFDAA